MHKSKVFKQRPSLIDIDTIFGDYKGPPIYACAAKDELLRRWRAGDQRAGEIAFAAFDKVKPTVLISERNAEICTIAAWLASVIPDAKRCAIAGMLANAGLAISRDSSLRPSSYPTLTAAQRQELAERVSEVLAWAPSWPGKRQIIDIIA